MTRQQFARRPSASPLFPTFHDNDGAGTGDAQRSASMEPEEAAVAPARWQPAQAHERSTQARNRSMALASREPPESEHQGEDQEGSQGSEGHKQEEEKEQPKKVKAKEEEEKKEKKVGEAVAAPKHKGEESSRKGTSGSITYSIDMAPEVAAALVARRRQQPRLAQLRQKLRETVIVTKSLTERRRQGELYETEEHLTQHRVARAGQHGREGEGKPLAIPPSARLPQGHSKHEAGTASSLTTTTEESTGDSTSTSVRMYADSLANRAAVVGGGRRPGKPSPAPEAKTKATGSREEEAETKAEAPQSHRELKPSVFSEDSLQQLHDAMDMSSIREEPNVLLGADDSEDTSEDAAGDEDRFPVASADSQPRQDQGEGRGGGERGRGRGGRPKASSVAEVKAQGEESLHRAQLSPSEGEAKGHRGAAVDAAQGEPYEEESSTEEKVAAHLRRMLKTLPGRSGPVRALPPVDAHTVQQLYGTGPGHGKARHTHALCLKDDSDPTLHFGPGVPSPVMREATHAYVEEAAAMMEAKEENTLTALRQALAGVSAARRPSNASSIHSGLSGVSASDIYGSDEEGHKQDEDEGEEEEEEEEGQAEENGGLGVPHETSYTSAPEPQTSPSPMPPPSHPGTTAAHATARYAGLLDTYMAADGRK